VKVGNGAPAGGKGFSCFNGVPLGHMEEAGEKVTEGHVDER
jgi:hypothetical protein